MKSAKSNITSLAVLITFSFLLNACSSTTFVQRWNDPEFNGPKLNKILVIGVIKDDFKRRSFEQDFVSLITTPDRKGITSYTFLPNLKDADSKEEILAAVKKTGVDGVLIVTLLGVSKEKVDVPPSVDYYPSYGYNMYGYYGASHSRTYIPGYTITNTSVSIETLLFNVANEKMVWAGNTKSFNASSSKAIIKELEKLVISDMQKSGIIN